MRTVGFAVFFRSFRAIALAEFFCASLRIPAIRGLCEKEGPFLLKKKKKNGQKWRLPPRWSQGRPLQRRHAPRTTRNTSIRKTSFVPMKGFISIIGLLLPCTTTSHKTSVEPSLAGITPQTLELELELIQTQMAQKPMLRAEVGMRVRCANKASAE